jgi:NADP-dependent 3-hydroxy acid dehydrogenase YdfG
MPTTPSLTGRTAIITGASAGIGLAIAEELASRGAKVVLNARRADRLDALAAELNRNHPEPRAAAAPGDSADETVIQSMFNTAKRRFGADADLVVINAGRGLAGSVATSDPAQWDEMIRTNILAAARLLRAAAHRLLGSADPNTAPLDPGWTARPRDIVVIGSIVGRHVSPFSSMYGLTKFAVAGMVEGQRRELAPKGIRLTHIAPGFVVSEFQGVAGYKDSWFQGVLDKIGPVLDPADVARVVAFACEQPAHVHLGDVVIRPTRQDYP